MSKRLKSGHHSYIGGDETEESFRRKTSLFQSQRVCETKTPEQLMRTINMSNQTSFSKQDVIDIVNRMRELCQPKSADPYPYIS